MIKINDFELLKFNDLDIISVEIIAPVFFWDMFFNTGYMKLNVVNNLEIVLSQRNLKLSDFYCKGLVNTKWLFYMLKIINLFRPFSKMFIRKNLFSSFLETRVLTLSASQLRAMIAKQPTIEQTANGLSEFNIILTKRYLALILDYRK